MRQLDTCGLKKIQLEILDVVMKFCDEHDILCFLDGGTLLGAVRHKGYIPWDDDIDLGMLRADYDKFMNIFNEKNTRYKFYSMENDPKSLYQFGMVLDTQTEYYEPDRKTGIKTSIHVDIWVMDNAPDNDKELKRMFMWQYIYRHLNAGRFLPMFAPPNGNIFRRLLAYSIRIPMNIIPEKILPRNYFGWKLLKNARKYIHEDTKRAGSFLGRHELAMDKSKFENFIYAEFEGRKYKIPSGYDEWLTKLYGNYMQLPPLKEQKTHHHFEAYIN